MKRRYNLGYFRELATHRRRYKDGGLSRTGSRKGPKPLYLYLLLLKKGLAIFQSGYMNGGGTPKYQMQKYFDVTRLSFRTWASESALPNAAKKSLL
jgi:hypothetical protein